MTDQHTPLDTRLERTLGAGSLSPEQRSRHMDRIAARARTDRFSPGRLLRDGAVLAVLIALLAGVWAMLPLGESAENDPMTAIADFRESINQPEPGEARYMTIELNSADIQDDSVFDQVSEIWEYTSANGEANRAILHFSPEGELLSRYVHLSDRWVYEGEGHHRHGRERNSSMVAPLPTYALEMTSTEFLKREFDEILNDEEAIIEEEDGQFIITRDGTYNSSSLGDEEEMADFSYLEELTIDIEDDRIMRWRLLADDGGEQLELYSISYGEWQDVDPSNIPEYVFAEQTELSESENDPMTAIAAMKEEITEPEPGTARYIEIDVLGIVPGTTSGLEQFTVRAWERWTDDGSAERAIHYYSNDGELIGRVVEFENRTVFEVPGNAYEVEAGLEMHPPELFHPLAAVSASEPSEFVDQLELLLEEEDVHVEDEEDGKIRVWMLSPEQLSDDMLMMYEQELGIQATGWGVEHLIDREVNRRIEWRVYVEDDEGDRHTLQHYVFDGWHEIDEQEIPDDAFAEYTELSEHALVVPLPDRMMLSFGTLEARNINSGTAERPTFTYVGPEPWLIEVRMRPLHDPGFTEFDGTALNIDGVSGIWQADRQVDDWPRFAVWEDQSNRFWLHARNLPEGGWTEADLYEVIEAISGHRSSP